ncbi:globin 1 [Carabus blaptoides fortunei]
MSGNGERLLVLYFESYPSNLDYFRDFRGKTVEELKGTPKFIAHGTNVICAINGIVMHLNEPAILVEVVKKVGYSHGRRQITIQALTELKATILKLFQEKLKTKYNQEVEKIWSKTLDIIMQVFQAGVQEHINDHKSDS